ncbi:MAG: hypothetical protein DCC73_12880 [Proteobacteria bacterium]|jgi:hypothetical protein|nr:MAG: hypothetical protein DCC73_12880 [Pseudomonadota bacterium]
MYVIVKILISAMIITAVSELAKRSTFAAAILVSLPLTSILAFSWIYWESRNAEKIAAMSYEVLWFVIPSLAFFLTLPALLRFGVKFLPAMMLSSLLVAVLYAAMMWLLRFVKGA